MHLRTLHRLIIEPECLRTGLLFLCCLVVFVQPLPVCAETAGDTTEELNRLLTLGEDHFKNWRYTSPAGDEQNAVSVFQKVLKLDAENAKALQRMKDMESYYIRKMKQAKNGGNEAKLKQYAQKTLIINSDNETANEVLGIKPEPTPEAVVEPTPPPAPKLSMEDKLKEERYKNYPDTILALLEEAQQFYMKRTAEDQSPIVKAMEKYEEILRINPRNYDALWQLSRAILWYGDHISEEKKVETFAKGMDYAKKAVEVNPNGIEGRYYHGSNMGKYGSARGIFKSLQYIEPIKEEMEFILKLDQSHHKATTVLGILFRKAPPWPVSIGDINKSQEYLNRAIQINPASLHSHLEMGITYNKLKDWDKAKAEFQKVLDLPMEERWLAENKEYKQEAREILMMMKRRGL